ncbi:MAG: hypothetical protein ACI88A_004904 [Paraglaciecola sp.]|jgi:hypothetical protein
MNKLLVVKRCTILSALILGLAACGGGGGTPAGVANTSSLPLAASNNNPYAAISADNKFTPGTGKLVAEIRPNGLSARYGSDEVYKAKVDKVLELLKEVVVEVGAQVKWPSDVNAVFSGCGQLNAFFGANFNVHDTFRTDDFGPVPDPASTYGANNIGSTLVFCHELTEPAIKYFEDLPNSEIEGFLQGDATDADELRLQATVTFLLQVLFHEVGHGLDQMLLPSIAFVQDETKFKIPVAGTCGAGANCKTNADDFADWIGALILNGAIEGAIEDEPLATRPEETAKWFGSLVLAINAWEVVMGPGGGTAHSTTESRQLNFACFAYGGLEPIRVYDMANGGQYLAALTAQITPFTPNLCLEAVILNEKTTETELGSFIKDDDTTDTPASGSDTEAESNNVAAAANTIVSTITGAVNGSTGSDGPTGSDPLDYFKFTPTSSGSHTVTLTWTGAADLDLYVEDSSEGPISSSATSAGQLETVFVNLTVGVAVLIKVRGFETSSAAVDYTLTIAQ